MEKDFLHRSVSSDLSEINLVPRARISFGQHQEREVRFLSMRSVLVLNFQPIRFERKGPEIRESRTFSSDLARVSRALGTRLIRNQIAAHAQKCDKGP